MADFGVGEGLALAAGEGVAKGAETAGAETAGAAGGFDLLAPAAGEGLGFAGAEGGLGGAEGIFGGVGDLTAGAGGGVAPSAAVDPIASAGFSSPVAGSGGTGAAAFAPAPGVQLPGGIAADATSAAAFNDLSFADRALPAVQAGQNGTFAGFELPQSPVGSGAGAADFSAAPPGAVNPNPGFPAAGTPTVSPNLGDFASPPGGQAAAGGLDISGNPIDPLTGSSNPQYSGGGTMPQYDPAGAGAANNTGTAAAPGSTNIISKIGQGAVDSVTKNPLGLALGAGGLAMTLANANKQPGAVQDVKNQASKQSQTADQLASYALTGTVPTGSQAGIDKAIAEAKANAISNAAGQGLPTDPTKNTALAATLAKIDAQRPIIAAEIAQKLLQSGATYAGLSDQLYTQLAQIDQSQRASMGKAIANFAAALNTGGGTKIQIGGTSA